MTDALTKMRELSERATAGRWEIQDGCSWRRIGTRGHDGNVLCPTNHPGDHHPDLTAGRGEDCYANLQLAVAAVNFLRLALSEEGMEKMAKARIGEICGIVDVDSISPTSDDIDGMRAAISSLLEGLDQ